MKYIVGFRFGNEQLFSVPMRGKYKTFSYPTVRNLLEEKYPGRTVYSPLETAKGKFMVVAVWVSPSKDGTGRIEQQFHEWAVQELDNASDVGVVGQDTPHG